MSNGISIFRGNRIDVEIAVSNILNDSAFEVLDLQYSSITGVEEQLPFIEYSVMVQWIEKA